MSAGPWDMPPAPSRIEDYAIIGDTHTAALVAADGSIDWLCVPRFDSGACFAALVGETRHGRWRLAPTATVRRTKRRYRPDTLVLETDFETPEGAVRVVDFMPLRAHGCHVVRVVEALSGSVSMGMELIVRFDYGSIVPWVRRVDDALVAVGGQMLSACVLPSIQKAAISKRWRNSALTAATKCRSCSPGSDPSNVCPTRSTPTALLQTQRSGGENGAGGARIRASGASKWCAR